MTTATKNNSYKHGWNAIVKALEDGNDLDGFAAKLAEIQENHPPSNGLFHYAEGAKDCLAEYEKPGIEIPERKS
jgi:hypothetical protein